MNVGVTLVKDYVHEWKRQRAEVFVPLVYRLGDLGEVCARWSASYRSSRCCRRGALSGSAGLA